MVDEQPQVELRSSKRRGRQRVDPRGQRGARDRGGVDLIGLATLAARAPRAGHQPRRHANDPLAAANQKPLKRAGHVAAVFQRPHPFQGRARAPTSTARRTRERRPRRSCRARPDQSRCRRRRSCASSCECPPQAQSCCCPAPFTSGCWTPGGQGLLRALPRSYQVTPDIPDRRRATQQKEVRPTGRQPQRESALRPVGTISTASDITDDPNPNSKPQGQQSLQVAPRGLGFRFAKALLEALPRLLVSTPIVSAVAKP